LTGPVTFPTLLSFILGATVDVTLLAYGARRLLAERRFALLPMLRRLPRRVDRIAAAVEGGRLSVNVRVLADERDRKVITGWVQLSVLAVLEATAGGMAVALLALKGGPAMTETISCTSSWATACWSSARCWRSACWPRCSGPGPNAAAGCPG